MDFFSFRFFIINLEFCFLVFQDKMINFDLKKNYNLDFKIRFNKILEKSLLN